MADPAGLAGLQLLRRYTLQHVLVDSYGPMNCRYGVGSEDRDHSGPQFKGPTMSDKSPRQTMSKKSGKSLKEKRVDKHAKASAKLSSADALLNAKKH
ncbi:hypothetical protein MLIT_33550 [Mycolicibacterium litorale]|uniref:Uncharacterized protein n=1 Tax=Mycolicibacterium litorale TaxID=758802 RepID=A0AAD1IU44_9MYCO|nr:hypothetical protein BCL50_1908 [Mycolicibacterium litorale]BBY17763.1 hypothetical protein MLIT_33550 [Mycolicibacterium litorale]